MNVLDFDRRIRALTSPERFLFSSRSLYTLLPDKTPQAADVFIGRAVQKGVLLRLCKGLFMHADCTPSTDAVLFGAAAFLRADDLYYLSLESVLSAHGCISQIPINRLTFITTGRKLVSSIHTFGTVEFVHTDRLPSQFLPRLSVHPLYRCLVASPGLAYADLQRSRRNVDLLNKEFLHEQF